MQNANDIHKSDCVNSAIRITSEVIYNFEHAGSGPLPRLGARMFPTKLRHAQGGSDSPLDLFGKSMQIGQTTGNPN
jgi:hypothetical protein